MPYKYPDNIPDAIKGLPAEAQKIWVTIYNSAYEQYKDNPDRESISSAVAWAKLRQAGWEQKDGKWVKVTKQKENPIMQTKNIQKEWSVDFVKVEEEMDNIEDLEQFLKTKLSTDWEKIKLSFNAYKAGELPKRVFIEVSIKNIGKDKFTSLFLKSPNQE